MSSSSSSKRIRAQALASVILGVPLGASQADIHKAYKKAALKYHPDRHSAKYKEAATKKFQDIAEAYSLLCSPKSSAPFDSASQKPSTHSTTHGPSSNGQHYSPPPPTYKTSPEPKYARPMPPRPAAPSRPMPQTASQGIRVEKKPEKVSEPPKRASYHAPSSQPLGNPNLTRCVPDNVRPSGRTNQHAFTTSTAPYELSQRKDVPRYWSSPTEPVTPTADHDASAITSLPPPLPKRTDGTTASTTPYASTTRQTPSYWVDTHDMTSTFSLSTPGAMQEAPRNKTSLVFKDGLTASVAPYGTSQRHDVPKYDVPAPSSSSSSSLSGLDEPATNFKQTAPASEVDAFKLFAFVMSQSSTPRSSSSSSPREDTTVVGGRATSSTSMPEETKQSSPNEATRHTNSRPSGMTGFEEDLNALNINPPKATTRTRGPSSSAASTTSASGHSGRKNGVKKKKSNK